MQIHESARATVRTIGHRQSKSQLNSEEIILLTVRGLSELEETIITLGRELFIELVEALEPQPSV